MNCPAGVRPCFLNTLLSLAWPLLFLFIHDQRPWIISFAPWVAFRLKFKLIGRTFSPAQTHTLSVGSEKNFWIQLTPDHLLPSFMVVIICVTVIQHKISLHASFFSVFYSDCFTLNRELLSLLFEFILFCLYTHTQKFPSRFPFLSRSLFPFPRHACCAWAFVPVRWTPVPDRRWFAFWSLLSALVFVSFITMTQIGKLLVIHSFVSSVASVVPKFSILSSIRPNSKCTQLVARVRNAIDHALYIWKRWRVLESWSIATRAFWHNLFSFVSNCLNV